MATGFDGRPFSSRLEEIRRLRGYRFVDLEQVAGRARSSGWFNNLLNGRSPWRVQPPSDDTIDDLAHLLETTPTHVREMIAEEWYDVARTEQSGRVRQFVLGIISLVMGVPITAIAALNTDPGLIGVAISWGGIVGVNAVHALSVRSSRRKQS